MFTTQIQSALSNQLMGISGQVDPVEENSDAAKGLVYNV